MLLNILVDKLAAKYSFLTKEEWLTLGTTGNAALKRKVIEYFETHPKSFQAVVFMKMFLESFP
jgi:hypothetical protein